MQKSPKADKLSVKFQISECSWQVLVQFHVTSGKFNKKKRRLLHLFWYLLTETLLHFLSFFLWFYSHFTRLVSHFTALIGIFRLHTSPKVPVSCQQKENSGVVMISVEELSETRISFALIKITVININHMILTR